MFRIEDTDAQRDSEESYNLILDALRWLGLDWDEGVEVGAPDGPYRQSERGDIYKDVASKLLEDRKSTRLNSSHIQKSRMPSSA